MAEQIEVDPAVLLCTAVKNGDLELVADLLRNGADVNMKSDSSLFVGITPLHTAVHWRHDTIAELLIIYGANVNVKDNEGETPIVYAIKYQNTDMIQLLLNNGADMKEHSKLLCPLVAYGYLELVQDLLNDGADVNMKSNANLFEGQTSLHTAAYWNQVEIAKLLINYGAKVNVEDNEGDTPIVYAMQKANTEMIDLLLINGADMKDHHKLLCAAVSSGCLKLVEDLLKNGVDVNSIANSNRFNGMTPLHTAVHLSKLEMANLLINYGAKVNVKNNEGETPIGEANKIEDTEMIKLLLINGADIREHCDLLCAAVAYGCSKAVEDLLKDNADLSIVNDTDSFAGLTPLHAAVEYNQIEIVKLLIKYGANVNVEDNKGDTPIVYAMQKANTEMIDLLLINGADTNDHHKLLCAAVSSGCLKLVEDLLKNGVDVNSIANSNGFNGMTPLHTAVHLSKLEMANLLINYGAKVNVKNNEGETPIGEANQMEDTEMIKLLLINGADIREHCDLLCAAVAYGCSKAVEDLLKDNADLSIVNDTDSFAGLTPLHAAVEYNQIEIVKLLIKYGANVNVEDLRGVTPIHYTFENCDVEMVDLLLSNGADIKRDGFLRKVLFPTNELLKQHIAKKKAAGLYVSQQNLLCIRNDHEINNFLSKCQAEINIMKSEKFDNSCASLYDMLTKNTSKLAKNESIVQALESYDYYGKFPIYASMLVIIDSQFKIWAEREKLVKQVRNMFLPSLFESLKELPHLCTEKIFSYLSDNDLKILLHACELLNK